MLDGVLSMSIHERFARPEDALLAQCFRVVSFYLFTAYAGPIKGSVRQWSTLRANEYA